MEQATLRPVPLRPAGPVDPAEASAHVARALPELDQGAAGALALIEIAGHTREQAGEETGLAWEPLSGALYRARKALRRSIFPLSASGWCERAERLLSDRLDGVLVPPGPARLDAHLRNCGRCIEHERRLSQAREKLVREFIAAHPDVDPVAAGRARVAGLRVVEPAAVSEEPAETYSGPTRLVAGFGGPVRIPVAEAAAPLPDPSFAGPGGQVQFIAEPRPAALDAERVEDPVEEPPVEEPPVEEPPAEDPPVEQTIDPAEPADATPSEHDAETADPLVPPDEEQADTRVADARPENEPVVRVVEPVVRVVEPVVRVVEPVVEPEPHPEPEPEPAAQPSPIVVAAPLADSAPPAIAAAAAPAVAPAAVRHTPSHLLWNGLLWISVGLAVFAVVVTVLALAGVDRIF